MSSSLSRNIDLNDLDSLGVEVLSIALIGPDAERRLAVASALSYCRGAEVREFSAYPPALDDVPRLIEEAFDVVIIDLDSNPEYALELVESICVKDSATVMVYSSMTNQEQVVRCMRAGAREFLDPPFDQNKVSEALVRASSHLRPKARPAKATRGRLLVFLGAKGGSGVTTIACNFAIALAQEPTQRTLLVDLGLPLGDAALNLGIASEYSTEDALRDPGQLDSTLLHDLLAKHESGVSVLAGPSKVSDAPAAPGAAIDKLVSVAREEFDYVVVDVGSRLDLMGTALFRDAYKIYLVTQAGISELRNSSLLISRFFSEGNPKLEIVINRFEPGNPGVTEENISKALGRPVRWRIPDDYDATRRMPNNGSPLSIASSPFSHLILEMTNSVVEHPLTQGKNSGHNLRDLGRSIAERIPVAENPPSIPYAGTISPNSTPAHDGPPPVAAWPTPTVAWPAPAPIPFGTPLSGDQLNATASVKGTFVYTPGPGYILPVGTHTLWATFTPAIGAMVQSAVSITVAKATPKIAWSTPAMIPCGAALGEAQLNARASVPGIFIYTPGAGEVLGAGAHTLSVTFTPTDTDKYTKAQATVSVSVARATPTISWPTPMPIHNGTPLGDAQLNATASVPGSFAYMPDAGEVLATGMHTLSVIFTPADPGKYTTAKATVQVNVTRTPLAIAWPTPDPITFGTPLGTIQLNATASVPGTFAYKPGVGAVLAAGKHTPSVTFTPRDTSLYSTAQAAIALTVETAVPAISWQAPEPIPFGTPLSAAQLNATAPIPGRFDYSPAAGEVLEAGAHTLSVTFTPADTMNYERSRASVPLTVARLTPTEINRPTPSAIQYGTALSSTELNATASVPGTFVYAPSAGIVLTPGKHSLSFTFIPADTEHYATVQAAVALDVVALADTASLLSAASRTPFLQTAAAVYTTPADEAAEWEGRPSGIIGRQETIARQQSTARQESIPRQESTPRQESPRETRTLEVVTNNPPKPQSPREVRTYKGVVYEKGEDGQWHRQQK